MRAKFTSLGVFGAGVFVGAAGALLGSGAKRRGRIPIMPTAALHGVPLKSYTVTEHRSGKPVRWETVSYNTAQLDESRP